MIKLLQEGDYTLIETKRETKILTLDKRHTYAWIRAGDIGEILIASFRKHVTDHFLALGKYRMYEVLDEKDLTDLIHLELLVGNGTWQGYLLPTGLPTRKDRRNRIIPTDELITKSGY